MFERRLSAIAVLGGIYFLVLIGRLFSMQVLDVEHWRTEAAKLARRHILLPARRGAILDRHGVPLAEDRLQRDLTVRFRFLAAHRWRCRHCARPTTTRGDSPPVRCSECRRREFEALPAADLSRLPALLGISPSDFDAAMDEAEERCWNKIRAEIKTSKAAPRSARAREIAHNYTGWEWTVAKDVSTEVVREVALQSERYPGFETVPTYRRVWTGGDPVRLLVGATGPVWSEEYDALRKSGLTPSQIYRMKLGRSGLEKTFEERLRAKEGWRVVRRDRRGWVTATIEEQPAQDGQDLRTSLDLRLQTVVTEALEAACRRQRARGGAFVAMDPATGEVLALATWPARPAGTKADPGIHRAITAQVPGSVFKVVTALSGLQSGELDPYERFECRGRWNKIGCHGAIHGQVDLIEALAVSCNGYFAQAAEKIGITLIDYWAGQFGFDRPTGIEVPGEGAGLIPDDAWKAERYPNEPRMYSGEIWQVGFGQGALMVTPLQMARLMSTLANGGRLVTPTLELGKVRVGEQVVGPEALALVRTGLREVVTRGSASRTALDRFRSVGKTGTATARSRDLNMAWFAGYAPAEAPRIAFACYLQDARGFGAEATGPVIVRFLEEYLSE